jgi:DNA helicase-2/ATP-dependent DNA helicase PcrA
VRGVDNRPLINTALLDGHDEHHPNYQHISAWLADHKLQSLLAFRKEEGELLRKHLATIHWVQAQRPEEWSLRLRKEYGLSKATKAKLTPAAMLDYKRLYWSEGIIDHEDVLYFAYRILHDRPLVRECLSARFPFIFVDEFQDTVPAQTAIVRWFAAEGTTVVVIGDAEQSIFEFAGATPSHFSAFTLPQLEHHEIHQNRRSTKEIIGLLNHVRRNGLVQECHRNVHGEPITLLVGTPSQPQDT